MAINYLIKEDKKENMKFDDEYFLKLGIKQCYVSNELKNFEERFCRKFRLQRYSDGTLSTVFFGLYNEKDLFKILFHKAEFYIMFGGTDIDVVELNDWDKIIKKITHNGIFSISKNIEKRLNYMNIKSLYINFNLLDKHLFKPVKTFGDKIYIYNGYSKEQERKYGRMFYLDVIKELPNYEYIYSNEINVPYDEMTKIYSQCFIGLRLTHNDGNANTVQEMVSMGIPVIHNGEQGGISWNTVSDIVNIIKYYDNLRKNTGFYKNNENISKENLSDMLKLEEEQNQENEEKNIIKEINILEDIKKFNEKNKINLYYEKNINNKNLEIIYSNIELITKFIKQYKNILFLCSDYPSYGGAATNCNKMAEFYSKFCNTYEVYYISENDKDKEEIKKKYNKNNILICNSDLEENLKKINFKPDLIILRNSFDINLKFIFNCPVIYCIAGLFKNSLNKYWYELQDKNEINEFINKDVLKQIENSDLVFCNSSNSADILKNHYKIETQLFYFGFVQYYGKYIDEMNDYNKEYEYDYGLICSNFNRKIKNIDNILESKKDYKVLLIGKNSDTYGKKYGFDYLDLIDNSEMQNYIKKFKKLLSDSYYESCSNILLEYKFRVVKTKENITNEFYLNKNKIYIIDDYANIKDLNIINEICNYFNKISITIKYILLHNKSYILNKNFEHIKIIDYTKNLHLEHIYNILLNNKYEKNTLIYNSKIVNNHIIEKIKKCFINVETDNNINKILSHVYDKPKKIFVNFSCKNIAYGGGNQFVYKLVDYMKNIQNFRITFKLEDNIDIYLIIDLRKERKREFKKYTFEEIYQHKIKTGGKIIMRVNDCDLTREKKEIENLLLKNIDYIDKLVFNSTFIKEYYCDNYNKINKKSKKIIYNKCDKNIFYPKNKIFDKNKKIKIVTHHWSDNINKGYDIYYEFNKYCKTTSNLEFVFIGRKFNDNFKDFQTIHGPYKGEELADVLRDCDIYITASVYDSCPMHVLEGLSCGLPMLYIDCEGGGKDLCEMAMDKIGESFNDISDLITKINTIINKYDTYRNNIIKNIDLYNSDKCYADFCNLFVQ